MLVQTVPGTAGISIPGAPVITFTDYDRAIAALPGLTYYIDPANPGADRKSGAIYINRNNDPLASVTVSAEMNGLPAWNMVSNLLQFRLPKNSARNSFTWLLAVYPTTIGNLALVEEGANENLNKFWISSATAMRFHTSNTGGIFEQKAAGTVLPLNTRGIHGVSFDYATRKSSILFASGSWSPEYTHSLAFDVEAKEPKKYVGHNPLAQLAMFFFITLGVSFMIVTGMALYAEGAQAGSLAADLFGWVHGLTWNSEE